MMKRRTAISRATLLVIIITVLIAITGIALLVLRPTNCGQDTTCFIKHAAACKDARVSINDERGSATLEEHDCVIYKTLTSLAVDEPALRALLVGKSMTCPHPRGGIPTSVFSSITSGTTVCSGELSNALQYLKKSD